MTRISVVFLLTLAVSTSFAATLTLGPEQTPIPVSYRERASDMGVYGVRIASNGVSYVLAYGASFSADHTSIFVSTLDDQANILKTTIITQPMQVRVVAVLWTGAAYRIVWQDTFHFYACDVDDDTNIVRDPHQLDASGGSLIAIAATPDRTLIATVHLISNYEVALLDANGSVVMKRTDITPVAVAADANAFVVFALDKGQVSEVRITSAGAIDGSTSVIGQVQDPVSFAAAANGGVIELVVAERTQIIRRFAVTLTGEVRTLTPLPAKRFSWDGVASVGVLPDRAAFLVYWKTGFSLATNRTGDDVEFRDLSDYIPNKPALPDVQLAAGRRVLAVSQWVSAFVLEENQPLVPVKAHFLRSFPVPQRPSAIASIGGQSLIVWTEGRPSIDGKFTDIVLGQRLDSNGSPLGDMIPIGIGAYGEVLAINGEYWVSWSLLTDWGERLVALRRIQTDGSMTATQLLASSTSAPRMAANDAIVVIAFGTSAVRITRSGDVIDHAPLHTAGIAETITSNGTEFLIAWNEVRRDCPSTICAPYTSERVLAARLDHSGQPLDPTPIQVTATRRPPATARSLAGVASDGRDFFIVYNDERGSFGKWLLREGVLREGSLDYDGTLIDEKTPAIAVERAPAGFLVFTSPRQPFVTRVIHTDRDGHADNVATFAGTFSRAVQSSPDVFVMTYGRPSDAPEEAGALLVRFRTLDLGFQRVRAVRRRY